MVAARVEDGLKNIWIGVAGLDAVSGGDAVSEAYDGGSRVFGEGVEKRCEQQEHEEQALHRMRVKGKGQRGKTWDGWFRFPPLPQKARQGWDTEDLWPGRKSRSFDSLRSVRMTSIGDVND